jgi:SAM-dependent methyltransferase
MKLRRLKTARRVFQGITGIDVLRMISGMRGVPPFLRDARAYSRLKPRESLRLRWTELFPIFHERFEKAGATSGHYFHQDLWAAKKIYQRGPQKHVDVGSRVDGFVAHVLVFMPITVVDIRDLDSKLQGLSFLRDDATQMAEFDDDSVDSLSSLHAAEHFGLGRYSDPVDPEACFNFMRSLQRVLCPGGRLYFSLPIGRERVEFNAHRVFDPATILSTFDQLTLHSFSYVDDRGDLHENVDVSSMPQSECACGLFEFTK